MPKKTTLLRNIETFVSAEAAAKFAQERFDSESVRRAIRTYHDSILKRMASLAQRGKPSGLRDAVEDLGKTRKGFAFEALLGARHLGKSPLNEADYGLAGSTTISPNDPQLDVKTISRGLFGHEGTIDLTQAKSSAKSALEAIHSERYDLPVIVPKDVFDELASQKDPQVLEAIRTKRLIYQQGDSGPINSKDVLHHTREELQRLGNDSTQERFYWNIAREMGQAATVGAVFRGGLTALRILIVEKKLESKHIRAIGGEAIKGGVQTASRVGLARGLEKTLIDRQLVSHGGQWLGRTAGAAASLVVSTVVDLSLLGRKKITGQEFGLRFSKNTVVAVATAVSGPLGLGVTLTITAGEVLYGINKENNNISDNAIKEHRNADRNIIDDLRVIQNETQVIRIIQDQRKRLAYQTKLLLTHGNTDD